MQSSLFNISGETPIQEATKKVKEFYKDKDDNLIRDAIRFAGLPLYVKKDCRDAFFSRIKTYLEVLIYDKRFCNKHNIIPIDNPNKLKPIILIFKETNPVINLYAITLTI